jgi:hypothetical protein
MATASTHVANTVDTGEPMKVISSIDQSLLDGGKYRLDKEIVYFSPRYQKTITVPCGRISDGATGAMDITSRGWWIHDELCIKGCWDDGSKLSNWQCSQVLQDVLKSEGRYWQSKRWFWATWVFGGGAARDNGLFKVAAMICILVNLTGCAAIEITGDIADILFPEEPVPVCDSQSVGAQYQGNICLKYSDNNFRWEIQQ